jgi:hypothetical protein
MAAAASESGEMQRCKGGFDARHMVNIRHASGLCEKLRSPKNIRR